MTSVNAERKAWISAVSEFDTANALVALVCDAETHDALNRFRLTCTGIAVRITQDHDLEFYEKSQAEIWMSASKARGAMRRELGIESAQ